MIIGSLGLKPGWEVFLVFVFPVLAACGMSPCLVQNRFYENYEYSSLFTRMSLPKVALNKNNLGYYDLYDLCAIVPMVMFWVSLGLYLTDPFGLNERSPFLVSFAVAFYVLNMFVAFTGPAFEFWCTPARAVDIILNMREERPELGWSGELYEIRHTKDSSYAEVKVQEYRAFNFEAFHDHSLPIDLGMIQEKGPMYLEVFHRELLFPDVDTCYEEAKERYRTSMTSLNERVYNGRYNVRILDSRNSTERTRMIITDAFSSSVIPFFFLVCKLLCLYWPCMIFIRLMYPAYIYNVDKSIDMTQSWKKPTESSTYVVGDLVKAAQNGCSIEEGKIIESSTEGLKIKFEDGYIQDATPFDDVLLMSSSTQKKQRHTSQKKVNEVIVEMDQDSNEESSLSFVKIVDNDSLGPWLQELKLGHLSESLQLKTGAYFVSDLLLVKSDELSAILDDVGFKVFEKRRIEAALDKARAIKVRKTI